MWNYTFVKRGLLCAALLFGICVSLPVQARKPPANNKRAKVKLTSEPMVFVAGAIKKTGPISVMAGDTLADVLARAGGWTPDADLSQIRISRREKANGVEQRVTQVVNFEDYVATYAEELPDESNNPVIEARDRIFVGFKAPLNPKK